MQKVNHAMKRPIQALMSILKEQQLTITFTESMTSGYLAYKSEAFPKHRTFLWAVLCAMMQPASYIAKHTAESAAVTDRLAKKFKAIDHS